MKWIETAASFYGEKMFIFSLRFTAHPSDSYNSITTICIINKVIFSFGILEEMSYTLFSTMCSNGEGRGQDSFYAQTMVQFAL